MKNLYFFLLMPLLSFGQTQIGANINGEAAGDWSGYSVSLSSDGSIVAIGATNNDGNEANSGHVRVYQNTAGVWTQIGADINGEATGDQSGDSVSLSSDGSIVAIGAFQNDGNGNNSGHVRIYQNISGVWTQIGTDINGEAAGDQSGCGVSLSSDGSTVAIGAYQNDGNGANSGHVRVYQNVAGVWTQIGADINGEAADDNSGYSVSLSSDGTIVAIGAVQNDGNGNNSGHVRIYQNISGVWTQIGTDINGEAAGDQSGCSVSLSSDGTKIAIGAIYNNGNGISWSGHVRVYQNATGIWTQIGADINGEALGDWSGKSVSLSSDGTIVVIGANLNSVNGTASGHVRVYQNVAEIWTQIGGDIDGGVAFEWCGFSTSISTDGSVIAVGVPNIGGNGSDSGHVRVFDLSAALSIATVDLGTFTVYPNPVANVLNIEVNSDLELQKVNFYNILGQLVKTATTNQIAISDLSKGNYIVEIITNQGKATKKISVQ